MSSTSLIHTHRHETHNTKVFFSEIWFIYTRSMSAFIMLNPDQILSRLTAEIRLQIDNKESNANMRNHFPVSFEG